MRIKQLGHPILREVSKSIETKDIASDEVQSTLNFMKETLDGIKAISDENGNAISAPQVGNAIRMILLRVDGVFMPMINPEFTARSEQMMDFEEECFSFYNLRAFVKRHQKVTVQYFDEHAQVHSVELEGEMSGLVQHEVDHLDGIFFLDRVEDPARLQSVDYILKDQPKRLTVVKEMMNYMAS